MTNVVTVFSVFRSTEGNREQKPRDYQSIPTRSFMVSEP